MSVGDLGFFLIVAVALVLLAGEAVAHPSQFAQVLVFGLAYGAIYSLVALGYTMVYGIIELINFAHGDVITLGAYVAAAVMGFFAGTSEDTFGVSNLVALLVTFPVVMLLMGAVNITIERVAYRPLRNAPRLAPLITAIGMSFLLEGIMFLWHGPATVHVPDLLPHGPGFQTTIGGVFISFKDIFVVVAASILVALLALFINRSKLGKAMRATAQDRDASQLMGININRTIAATFFIGALLAGAGGMIWGLYFNTITYNLGFRTGLIVSLVWPLATIYATDSTFLVAQAGHAGTFVLLAIGLNVVVGFAGLLDLGYAAFFAIGAYTYALFASNQLASSPIHHQFHLPF